jgi:hypothetical protein
MKSSLYSDSNYSQAITVSAEAVEADLHLLAELLESPPRSLRHRSHLRHVRKGHRAVRRVMAAYFRRQKAEIVHHVRPLLAMLREDRKTAEERAAWLLPDTLSPLSFPITGGEASAYNAAITASIEAAARQLAREIETNAALPETFAGNYLREHSLSKLTGEIAETTKARLRTAVADAFESGGTADDIVRAIKSEMSGMETKRAELISQTEINTAYNAGRAALAGEAGMSQKSWVTESGDPCPACTGNEAQGWIPIADFFQSGDAQPTAHPMCYCSLDFRVIS